jgi:hypothetical protein
MSCEHCGLDTKEEHEASFQFNAVDYITMKLLGNQNGGQYEEVTERILLAWRTHALPECDPLAIS